MEKGFRFEFGEDFLNEKLIEYFVPYEIEVLKEYCGVLFYALRHSDEIRYPQLLESIPDNADNVFWINDNTIITELSLYDYYSDAKAICRMAEVEGITSDELPNEYYDKELLSRLYYKQVKIDLSILLRIPQIEPEESVPSTNYRNYVNRLKYYHGSYLGYLINYASYLQRVYKVGKSHLDTLRMLISKVPKLIESLIEKINNLESADYCRLRDAINIYKYDLKYSKRYQDDEKDGRGCFAILKIDGERNVFFAISDYYDYVDTDAKVMNYYQEKPRRKKKIDAIVKLAEEISRKLNLTWCRLCDNTLKYVDENSDHSLTFLTSSKKLSAALLEKKSTSSILQSYSCCERKLFAKCSPLEINKFYIRWFPCEKCIPAFCDFQGTTYVYAFAKDFHEWKRKGYIGEIKIQAKFFK